MAMLDRRAALQFGFGGFVAGFLPELARASGDTGVFWDLEANGARGVLFGYQRVAAAAVPEILADGERVLKGVNAVYVDHGDIQKTVTVPNKELKPLLAGLQPDLAEQVRTIVLSLGVPQDQVDEAPAVLVLMALIGEGAPAAKMSVAGTLFERAKAAGKPAPTLMNEAETRQFLDMLGPATDMTGLTLSDNTVRALLVIRREVGPIGAHCVTLYRARKIRDLHEFSRRLEQQGIPPLIWRNPDAAARMYLDIVAPRIMTELAGGPTLFFVNEGTFLIDHGLLARLREQGAALTALA
jgi:hypothetical protein